jgi:hypothetical protein
MEKLSPFGISYNSNVCTIKLKFHPRTWDKGPIVIGKNRLTKTGYVIFECELSTKTDDYHYVINQIKKITSK